MNEYGTDPHEKDTDGDGIPDGSEINQQDRYTGADPLQIDIFVEVDEMQGTSLQNYETNAIISEFENAPLENVDGSTGINLHFVFSDTVPHERSSSMDGQYSEYKATYFDNDGYGYHYLLIVNDVEGDSDGMVTLGQAIPGNMIVEDYSLSHVTGTTVMHELGHSLGLSRLRFEGIDSGKIPFRDYPSVMNYNANIDYYGYSNGDNSVDDFDDWASIEESMYIPNTGNIDIHSTGEDQS